MIRISVNLFLVFLFSLYSCKFKPFVKYQFQNKKTNLPSFHKKDFLQGSKNDLRISYDLIKYDWYVKPNPSKKSIEGKMSIEFRTLKNSTSILLDLHKRLKIDEIECEHDGMSYKHKGDLLYIHFNSALVPGESYTLDITYHGKPVIILKEGPIQWEKDKNGKDWISTQTEGIGAHYMMPCKLLLYDEPETCIIRVETSNDLSVVANGRLDSITQKENSHIFHHSVHNPINIYNISFNIGDFAKIEKHYTDFRDIERIIEFFPLKYDSIRADTFYNDVPLFMGHLESLFGPFPWWNDGCKFVQSTLAGSAMEHQSAISMGSIYYYDYIPPGRKHINTTVIHELAHEWWGNMISADDYAHMWIHEGMATYAELLVIEKIYGRRFYDWSANRLRYYVRNERPVIKTEGVLYNSWANDKDANIYYKGAMCLHSLRVQLNNDSLFLAALKNASLDFAMKNINSNQFETYLSQQLNSDFSWLFDIYLRNTEVPTISYSYDSLNSKLKYLWTSTVLNQEKLKIHALDNKGERIRLYPKSELQEMTISKGNKDLLDVANNGYVIFNNLKEENN